MKNKAVAEAIENVLIDFWNGKSAAGAYHACAMVTNANQKWIDSKHHKMTVEEATEKILEIFEEAK